MSFNWKSFGLSKKIERRDRDTFQVFSLQSDMHHSAGSSGALLKQKLSDYQSCQTK